jgi:enterochelin esterase-like enzyme
MQKEKAPVLESILVEQTIYPSDYLERDVTIDAYLPKNIVLPDQMSLLMFNDGQDLVKMPFEELLDKEISKGHIEPLMCVGIHCGEERKLEYGTAHTQDYKGRGSKAGLYTKFVFDELLPYIRKKYHVPHFKEKAFAGFSLGGLSALDMVWNQASEFTKVGVFSGSFWWRRKSYDEGYSDEMDRIMHLQVRKGICHPWLKFFFECGALDEEKDRNKNGIIDSIDDTLDLIVELKAKGFTDEHITYLELADGKHDIKTWQKVLPEFLKWGWEKEK